MTTLFVRDGVIISLQDGTTVNCDVDVNVGGTIKADTIVSDLTFGSDFNNDGVAGANNHTGTITISGTVTGCGEYLGGFSTYEPATCGTFSIDYTKRYEFDWDVTIANDNAPQCWNGLPISAVTDYGLYVTSNRLIFDYNGSPQTTPPMGVYLHSYGSDHPIGLTDTSARCYHYTTSWAEKTSTFTMGDSNIMQIMSTNLFTSLYIDLDTNGTGDFKTELYYYNGSWVKLQNSADHTLSLHSNGVIEFNAPYDWTTVQDPVSGTFTGYGIQIKVTSAPTVSPQIDPVNSNVYTQVVDDSISEPTNIMAMKQASISTPSVFRPSSTISAQFNSAEIGRLKDSDGFIVSGESRVIRGISLTNNNVLRRKIVSPVSVSITSANVGASDGYVDIPNTNPKPDIPLVMYATSSGTYKGECVRFSKNIYVTISGSNWRVHGLKGLHSSYDYKFYYLPMEIDMSSSEINGETVKRIVGVFGPTQTMSYPEGISTGIVSSSWTLEDPDSIVYNMSSGKFLGHKDLWNEYYTKEKTKSEEKKPYVDIDLPPIIGGRNNRHEDDDKFLVKRIHFGSRRMPRTYTRFYMSDDLGDKFIVKTPLGKSFIFSFNSMDRYPSTLMRFYNPGALYNGSLDLQISFSLASGLNVSGVDFYVWTNPDGIGKWEKVGGTDINYGDRYEDIKTIPITTDLSELGRYIYVMAVSKFPEFTQAKGLIVNGDVPEEDLSKTFNEIHEEFTNNEFSGERDLSQALPWEPQSTHMLFNTMFARIITHGTSDSATGYMDGIDYTYDDSTHKITFRTTGEKLNKLMERRVHVTGRKYYTTPAIVSSNETYTDIGKLGSTNGEWNNDETIEPRYTEAGFNFEFAINGIPYCGEYGIHGVFVHGVEKYIGKSNMLFKYRESYEYSSENDYKDNKIKRHNQGMGCYTISVKDIYNTAMETILDEDDIYMSLFYTSLTNNYYIVDYIVDTDYGIFSTSLLEENSFTTPKRCPNSDTIFPQVQLTVGWPRGEEPWKTIEEEEE